jgi:hypothetical protein
MIPLKRIRDAVFTYQGKDGKSITLKKDFENFAGSGRETLAKKLLIAQRELKQNPDKDLKFDSLWSVTKDRLFVESSGKCAYCESPTKVVAYGDVEHYRPKSKYWWLAYCYDNYTAACTICNQQFKKANFNTKKAPMKALVEVLDNTSDAEIAEMAKKLCPDPVSELGYKEYLKAHKAEAPLLINPYIEDPAKYFAYIADDNLSEVAIVPTTKLREPFVKEAIEFYGLNRLELKQARYAVYETYDIYKNTLKQPINSQTQAKISQQLKKLSSDSSPYAGMIRYFESKTT